MDSIVFDVGGASAPTFVIPDASGLTPLVLPTMVSADAVRRFETAMSDKPLPLHLAELALAPSHANVPSPDSSAEKAPAKPIVVVDKPEYKPEVAIAPEPEVAIVPKPAVKPEVKTSPAADVVERPVQVVVVEKTEYKIDVAASPKPEATMVAKPEVKPALAEVVVDQPVQAVVIENPEYKIEVAVSPKHDVAVSPRPEVAIAPEPEVKPEAKPAPAAVVVDQPVQAVVIENTEYKPEVAISPKPEATIVAKPEVTVAPKPEVEPETKPAPVVVVVDKPEQAVAVEKPAQDAVVVEKPVPTRRMAVVETSETPETTVLQAAPIQEAASDMALGAATMPHAADSVSAATARTEAIVETVNKIVEAVVGHIVVTPSLVKGEGEVRITLKPDVLDGSEIALSSKDGALVVAVTPATPEAAKVVAEAMPRLETALAEHVSAFHHVAVKIVSKKGNADETA